MVKELKGIRFDRCFCQIPIERLVCWLRLRQRECLNTVQMLSRAQNEQEREEIGIVALLDVDDQTLLNTMSGVGVSEAHILECRERLRQATAHMKG